LATEANEKSVKSAEPSMNFTDILEIGDEFDEFFLQSQLA